jgi:hypothetical protein
MSKRKCLLEVAWLGVLIAGVAATPAAAMCWGGSMPCCDIRPSPDLACVVSLWQGRLAPTELVGDLD